MFTIAIRYQFDKFQRGSVSKGADIPFVLSSMLLFLQSLSRLLRFSSFGKLKYVLTSVYDAM